MDDGCVGGLVGDGAAVVVVGGDEGRGLLVEGRVGWWGGERERLGLLVVLE